MMRYQQKGPTTLLGTLRTEPAAAMREAFREGYGRKEFIADILAGTIVGIVALPLAMALAIASGVPPQQGLYTSIIAGILIAVLGGSRYQVSGPTAAFVVILAPISAQFGLGGLLLSTMMAGVIMFAIGVLRMGKTIEFIPYPVMTGFTAGIGVTIATGQLKYFLGLQVEHDSSHFLEKIQIYTSALPGLHWQDFAVGGSTLALLLLLPKVTRKIPAPLLALAIVAAAAEILRRATGNFSVATIGNCFSYTIDGETRAGIPQMPPMPMLPWKLHGPDGAAFALDYATFRALLPSAFAIALLGAIESLLSASVADGMTSRKHRPDAELMAQGIGNIVAPFFGGIAATGAIARTATGVRAGAVSPICAIWHGIFVLIAVLLLAPWLGFLPMGALAGLLMLVAWNMSEVKHFFHIVRVAPKSDVAVLLSCFFLTVIFDMVVSVSFGVVFAALLFMKRMAESTEVSLTKAEHHEHKEQLPKGVVIYEIAGPLFFGAAQRAMSALSQVNSKNRTVILNIESVPTMDVTGLVALESALNRLWKGGAFVVITGLRDQPARVLANAGIENREGRLAICKTYEEALDMVWTREAQMALTGQKPDSVILRKSAISQ
ncbi:MAG: C4-dicarboxylic acid transporter DauA [Planctomycetes bacterium]|nr:C4-dicarboxylic acid transporter DauA [Planctomycetota bacterium]